jgi:RNA polymerase sigma-70 factor (ECF subfamily)
MAWAVFDNEKDLLLRISEGDCHAFNELYLRVNASLYNAVMIYIKDENLTQDILQEIYSRIWSHRQKLTSIENLKNYLFIMARNVAFNHLKHFTLEQKFKANLNTHAGEQVAYPEIRSEQNRLDELLQKAIHRLPAQQQRAWLLSQEESLSYIEIAERMHLSKYTVKRHLEVARQAVRGYLSQHIHRNITLSVGLFLLSKWLGQ